MAWKRKLGIGCGGVAALALLAGGWIWVTKPWVPEVEVAAPGAGAQRITDGGMIANFHPGKGDGARPAILLLGGSEGGLSQGVEKLAATLANEGFAVLAVSYYRAPGQPEKFELVPLETFDRAIAWLKARADVDPARIGIVGASKGAEGALLVASCHPDIHAVVAAMPSSVVWQGFDWNMTDVSTSSWSVDGKPVPFVPITGGFGMDVYTPSLKNAAAHPDAAIAVEKIAGPVLLICGEQDTLWPSCGMGRTLKARAVGAKEPAVTLLAYPDAGHGVFGLPRSNDDPDIKQMGSLGGSGAGNNNARADAWPKVIEFLKTTLGRQGQGGRHEPMAPPPAQPAGFERSD